jgi:4-amino-4-deoxy-L-arabinose transferase-like glycosyltransferase
MRTPTGGPGFARRLGLIAAAGLAVRLVYVLVLTPHLRGLGDATYYHVLANVLGDGRGFVDPSNGTATALHPPLFPLLLALPSALGLDSYQAHRVVVALIGTATVVAAGVLARHVAGQRAGLIAAGLAAVSPVLISADGAVMSETLLGLLVALCALAAYRVNEKPSMKRAALLGGLIGLATLTRGEAILLLPLLIFVLPRPRWKPVLAVTGCCFVVLAPWTIRNLTTFDKPVPISTNEGNLLAGANCPTTYHGSDTGSWDFRCVKPGPLTEDESVTAARLRRDGLDYAGDHAGRVPVVLAARLGRTFELYQPIRQAQHAEGRAEGLETAGAIWFFLLLPPALYGAVLLRRRHVPLLPLLALFGLPIAATVIGYGVPRFRHPADVALTVLAAVAVGSLGAGSSVASPRSERSGGLTSRFSERAGRSTT